MKMQGKKRKKKITFKTGKRLPRKLKSVLKCDEILFPPPPPKVFT
jgi:hypothetical protein